MAPQIKMFANGMKAVLTSAKGNKPSVLRVFDKNGCLTAQRTIRSVHLQENRTLEKMTLTAQKDEDGVVNLAKNYVGKTFNNEGKMVDIIERQGTYLVHLPFTSREINCNSTDYRLALKEYLETGEKGETSSDKTLWKMLKQWCDFRRSDTLRIEPKPMNVIA